jgi:endonuclease/exonuclease/phosphatase (EEP) superfamily protein YafD
VVFAVAAWSVCGLSATLMLFSAADQLGLLPAWCPLFGMSYLPVGWIVALGVIGAAVFGAARRLREGLVALAVSLAFLALFGDYSLAPIWHRAPSAPAARRFSVCAFNVQYYHEGIDRVAEAIRASAPDVALLSENVLPPGGEERMRALLEGYTFFWGRPESTAIATRLPLIRAREVELPSRQASLKGSNTIEEVSARPHRAFTHAEVDVGGVRVHVLSVRFIAGRAPSKGIGDQYTWGRYVLKSQLEEVRFFTAYVRALRGPVVFGGDLNAVPSSTTVRRIRAVATDVYLRNHFRGRATFKSHRPRMRLDYLFVAGGVAPIGSEVVSWSASDHLPVRAQLCVEADARETGMQ